MGGWRLAECRRRQPLTREHTFRCSPGFQLQPGTFCSRTRFRMPALRAALQVAAHWISHSSASALRPEQAEIALVVSPFTLPQHSHSKGLKLERKRSAAGDSSVIFPAKAQRRKERRKGFCILCGLLLCAFAPLREKYSSFSPHSLGVRFHFLYTAIPQKLMSGGRLFQ